MAVVCACLFSDQHYIWKLVQKPGRCKKEPSLSLCPVPPSCNVQSDCKVQSPRIEIIAAILHTKQCKYAVNGMQFGYNV